MFNQLKKRMFYLRRKMIRKKFRKQNQCRLKLNRNPFHHHQSLKNLLFHLQKLLKLPKPTNNKNKLLMNQLNQQIHLLIKHHQRYRLNLKQLNRKHQQIITIREFPNLYHRWILDK